MIRRPMKYLALWSLAASRKAPQGSCARHRNPARGHQSSPDQVPDRRVATLVSDTGFKEIKHLQSGPRPRRGHQPDWQLPEPSTSAMRSSASLVWASWRIVGATRLQLSHPDLSQNREYRTAFGRFFVGHSRRLGTECCSSQHLRTTAFRCCDCVHYQITYRIFRTFRIAGFL